MKESVCYSIGWIKVFSWQIRQHVGSGFWQRTLDWSVQEIKNANENVLSFYAFCLLIQNSVMGHLLWRKTAQIEWNPCHIILLCYSPSYKMRMKTISGQLTNKWGWLADDSADHSELGACCQSSENSWSSSYYMVIYKVIPYVRSTGPFMLASFWIIKSTATNWEETKTAQGWIENCWVKQTLRNCCLRELRWKIQQRDKKTLIQRSLTT